MKKVLSITVQRAEALFWFADGVHLRWSFPGADAIYIFLGGFLFRAWRSRCARAIRLDAAVDDHIGLGADDASVEPRRRERQSAGAADDASAAA